jgi:hypothetical protein
MGAQGTTTINFGAFPGGYDTSVAVTGQASITGTSLVEAWIFPTATADHSADEHLMTEIKVRAGNVVAGVGFTIYGFATSTIIEEPPKVLQSPSPVDAAGVGVSANYLGRVGGGSGVQGRADSQPDLDKSRVASREYGQWTVAWVFN